MFGFKLLFLLQRSIEPRLIYTSAVACLSSATSRAIAFMGFVMHSWLVLSSFPSSFVGGYNVWFWIQCVVLCGFVVIFASDNSSKMS